MRSLPNGWNTVLAKLGFTRTKRRGGGQQNFRRSLRFESLEYRRVLAPVTVSTVNDVVNGNVSSISALIASPGADGISLREAIQAANADAANDSINFSVSGTINLSSLGELVINTSVSINGPGAGQLTIRAFDPTPAQINGDGTRIFTITDLTAGIAPPNVEIVGLTLTGADIVFLSPSSEGGAIRSEGTLSVRQSVIKDNHASTGGAVFVQVAGGGTTARNVLTLIDATIDNNDASTGGGVAIVSGSMGTPTTDVISITRTTISNNDALFGSGGGVYANLFGAALTIADSKISGNTTAASSDGSGAYGAGGGGGGVYARLNEGGSLSIAGAEVSGNSATYGNGGGILAKAFYDNGNPFPTPRAITISRSLIADNTANDRGGGIYTFNREGTEALVEDSRVTGNEVPTTASGGHRNGGGIYAYVGDQSFAANDGALTPKFTITRSTVDDNRTPFEGGGIFVCSKFFGNFVATNTTFSGNRTTDESSGAGGGIFLAHYPAAGESIDAYLRNLTITQNVSALGGGLATSDDGTTRVRIANSIISENFGHQPAPNNLVGRVEVVSFKHNLIGSGVQVRDTDGTLVLQDLPSVNMIPAANMNILFNNSPLLRALADNGGPTPTHALRYEPQNSVISPAIDAGSDALVKDPLTNLDLPSDQRGPGSPARGGLCA